MTELESFGSLGWSLIPAYMPISDRHWRVLSLETRHPGVRSAWQEGKWERWTTEKGEEEPRLLWLLLSCFLGPDHTPGPRCYIPLSWRVAAVLLSVPFAPHTIHDPIPFLPVKQALKLLRSENPDPEGVRQHFLPSSFSPTQKPGRHSGRGISINQLHQHLWWEGTGPSPIPNTGRRCQHWQLMVIANGQH